MKYLESISKTFNYFNIINISISLFSKVYVFNRIRTKKLIRELNKFLAKFKHTLNGEQIKRIQFYTIQSCLTNSWFCQLRGKRSNSSEIRKAIYLGAITPLLDDLVDSEKINSYQILEQIHSVNNESSGIMQIISYLYHEITTDCGEEFKLIFTEALIAQDDSISQLQKEKLNHHELFKITKRKGENWTLLYRNILHNQLITGEKEAIRTLGCLLQLTNDAFDIYKDYKNGQQSIYTNADNLEPLYQQFNQLTNQMIAQFMETEYSTKDKRKAIFQIMLIISRGIVCLQQLLLCQKKTDNRFKIEIYSRKELICDMEKFGNIWKMMRICHKYSI